MVGVMFATQNKLEFGVLPDPSSLCEGAATPDTERHLTEHVTLHTVTQ